MYQTDCASGSIVSSGRIMPESGNETRSLSRQ
jgi:hypothetical protein